MTIRQVETTSLRKHFIVGTFRDNYIFEVMSIIGDKLSAITEREVLLFLLEDYYADDHLSKEHFEEGIETVTTITVASFLRRSPLKNTGEPGYLHVSMYPEGFRIVFDTVDFPNEKFLSKIPQDTRVKTFKQLWNTVEKIVEIRNSLTDKIEAVE